MPVVAALALALALAASCASEDEGALCGKDSDCPGDAICVEHHCAATPASTANAHTSDSMPASQGEQSGSSASMANTGATAGSAAMANEVPIVELSACAAFAQAVCAKMEQCIPDELAIAFGGRQGCEQLQEATCTRLQALADTVPIDPGACAQGWNGRSCDAVIAGDPLTACEPQPGTRATGIQCQAGNQCQSGVCTFRLEQTCGACDSTSLPPLSAIGGSCETPFDCRGFLSCASGRCQVPVANGSACTDSNQCSLLSDCKAGVCESAKVAGPGERCGLQSDDSLVLCAGQTFCDPAREVCIVLGEEGAPCDFESPCGIGLRCVQDTCHPFDSLLCPAELAPSPMIAECGFCDTDSECAANLVCGRTSADVEGGFCVPNTGTTECCLSGDNDSGFNVSLCLYIRSEYHR